MDKKEGVEVSSEPRLSEKKWFAVRTFSGHEKKVKEYLDKKIDSMGIQDKVSPVHIPYERFVEIRDGKKKSKVKNAFPGYVLIEAVLDNQTKAIVLESPSVMNFLGAEINGMPTPLRQEEVDRLFESQKDERSAEMKSPFSMGASVRVIDGPFGSLVGIVQEVHLEKMKLKILINFFGRSTPVEVDFSDVKLIID